MKVFVSSTAKDLAAFRAAAIRALRRLGHEVIAMEDFTAATSYPLDRVLERVRACDAYVVIVAWRYGYVPDHAKAQSLPLPGATGGRVSITEWEYRAARENPARPVLPFLLSESAPWPPQDMDGFEADRTGDPVTIDRVKAFRSMLMREHLVSFFAREEEMEALVSAAITTARLSRGIELNTVDVGNPVQGWDLVPDSSYTEGLVGAVRTAGSHTVMAIDIATGWWSTRLYLLAFLLHRLTGVRRLLVLDGGSFAGLLPVRAVVRVMASIHPDVARFETNLRARTISEPDLSREADALVHIFATSVGATSAVTSAAATPVAAAPGVYAPRNPADAHPTAAAASTPDDMTLRDVEERLKVDVTRANLMRWFEDLILTSPIRVESIERISPLDSIRIFDYPGDFVPVTWVEGKPPDVRQQTRVIDKPALSLQLAKAYVTDLLDDVHR